MDARLALAQEQHRRPGHLRMYTLTVDPKPWPSASMAYDAIRESQRINKLCTWLRNQHGPGSMSAWVLEWQGNGWPHWHVLVWSPARPYVPKSKVDQAWRYGYTRYDDPKRGAKVSGMRHAVRYITSYLAQGKHPAPEWVMTRARVRHMGSCSTWGPIVAPHTPTDDQAEDADQAARSAARPIGEAVAACCGTMRLVETVLDTTTGELRRKYLGRVPVGIRQIRAMATRLSRDGPQRRIGHAVLQLGPGWQSTTLGRALKGMMIHE